MIIYITVKKDCKLKSTLRLFPTSRTGLCSGLDIRLISVEAILRGVFYPRLEKAEFERCRSINYFKSFYVFLVITLKLTFKNCFARILKVGEKSINYIICFIFQFIMSVYY